MIHEINLSQVLAMIAVSGSVKQIKIGGGDLSWRKLDSIDVTENSHTITIWWKRSEFCGCEKQHLCMILKDMRKPYPWGRDDKKFLEPILKAYYYEGDNCNRRTQFLYEIIGNKIDIIDDIGLVGNGGVYHNKTNLLKIDPNKVYGEKVRCEGMWSYANGGSTK